MSDHGANRIGLEWAAGSQHAEEQLPMGTLGTTEAQVANQHVGGFIRQGQLKHLPRFGLQHTQRAPLPVNIVERQTN
jgi:hypothetical protein